MKTNKKIAAGALAAAAAAGYYYFYVHKDAAKNRKMAEQWAKDLQREALAQAKKLKHVDKQTVLDLVDGAAAAYRGVRGVDRQAFEKAAKQLKDNWRAMMVQMNKQTASGKHTQKKRPRASKK